MAGVVDMKLFRQQAIDYQQRLYGEVLLVPPLRWSVVIGLLLVLLAATAAFLTWGTYSRTLSVSGTSLSADQVALRVPVSAIQHISLGQPVRLVAAEDRRRATPLIHGTISRIFAPAAGSAQPYARVTVHLERGHRTAAGAPILKPGTPVEARIVLAPRPLFHWMMTGDADEAQ